LRERAVFHGRTVEAEARNILSDALGCDAKLAAGNIADAIRAIMAPVGGVDLEPFANELAAEPQRLD
jgi:plasmid stability protein